MKKSFLQRPFGCCAYGRRRSTLDLTAGLSASREQIVCVFVFSACAAVLLLVVIVVLLASFRKGGRRAVHGSAVWCEARNPNNVGELLLGVDGGKQSC